MKNRGISLITLIITIIVIIILAGVVIFSLSKSNPTSKATEAVFKSDVKTFLEELELYKLNKTLETKGSFVSTSLYATETSLKYDDKVQT